IFIEDESAQSGFRLAYTRDLPVEPQLPADFLAIASRYHQTSGYILADEIEGNDGDANRRMLHYYVPCCVRDRLVAVIGLGKTIEGAMLTSEDIELVRGL